MLEAQLRMQLKNKKIGLMTHIVLGYPSLDANKKIIHQMVQAGVDLMELQIPFSEPIADGPVILKANQKALETGITVQQCIDFAKEMAATHSIPFLLMTYYNILYQFGIEHFVKQAAENKVYGTIIPDLPIEEGHHYIQTMNDYNLSPIFIFSPTTTDDRMKHIASYGKGFIYCVARKGVTGQTTTFSNDLSDYLARCRSATHLPIAVGFGVKDKEDIQFLHGKADIAVIGTQTIRIVEENGIDAVGPFIQSLMI